MPRPGIPVERKKARPGQPQNKNCRKFVLNWKAFGFKSILFFPLRHKKRRKNFEHGAKLPCLESAVWRSPKRCR